MADENWAYEADRQEDLSRRMQEFNLKKELVNKTDSSDIYAPYQTTKTFNEQAFKKRSKLNEEMVGTERKPAIQDDNFEKPLTCEENSLLRKLLQDKLVQSNQELDIQQRDPSSPLYSVKSFEELHLKNELLKGVYAMGFNRPSKIQETALPLLLANPAENMIAQSQSGTGKTAAFVLTMLSRINCELSHPQCLCLSPTYELALQTGKVVELMGKFLSDLKVAYAVRGNKGEID